MTPDRSLPIAMFDSGVGGLTVLHECLVSLPAEDFLYLGDSANFPYGTKSAAELRELVVAQHRVPARPRRQAADRRLQLGDLGGGGRRRGEIAAAHGVEVVTVIGPEAEIAAAIIGDWPGRGAGDAGDRRRRRLPPRRSRRRGAASR